MAGGRAASGELRPVSRWRAAGRAAVGICPNCGRRGLFRSWWRMHPTCPHCGLPLEGGDGFFLGSMTITYGLVVFGFLAPVAGAWILEVIGEGTALFLAGGGAILLPVALHAPARCWWLACYYLFLVQELPVNGGRPGGGAGA